MTSLSLEMKENQQKFEINEGHFAFHLLKF